MHAMRTMNHFIRVNELTICQKMLFSAFQSVMHAIWAGFFLRFFFSFDCIANILMVILVSIFSKSTNWFAKINEISSIYAHEMCKLIKFNSTHRNNGLYHYLVLMKNLFMYAIKITIDFKWSCFDFYAKCWCI